MPASIAGLFNAMIFGILCNASWILTAISVLITVIVTLTYYSVMFNYVDFITISIVSNSMIFMVIALYKVEKRDKTELLQFAQIRRMNEELKSILMNLPEGIVLINDETHEVVLQNSEFHRIFAIPEFTDVADLEKLIHHPTVKVYCEGGNTNDLRTEYNVS